MLPMCLKPIDQKEYRIAQRKVVLSKSRKLTFAPASILNDFSPGTNEPSQIGQLLLYQVRYL